MSYIKYNSHIMTKIETNTAQQSKSWDKYWQGTADASAISGGGVNHPAVRAFWEYFFNTAKQNYDNPKIIDIATGYGAVVETALTVFTDQQNAITALDVSASAIADIQKRFPDIKAIVSDASSIPLESKTFTIVTSQFGVEYAGENAIYEAARLVADSGTLALLLHSDSSLFHKECQQSLEAIIRLQETRFIPLAIEMFDAGFKAVGGAERSAYDNAAKKLAPAIIELENIMTEYGQHVAGDTISRLYNDVAQIHEEIQHYQADDIFNWLKTFDEELVPFAERMSSMNQSAINNSSFEQIKASIQDSGFLIEQADALVDSELGLPLAWVLIAKKYS